MFDLSLIKNHAEVSVGEVFAYKNRLFLKIRYRAVIKNVRLEDMKTKFTRQNTTVRGKKAGRKCSALSNQSNKDDEEEDDEEDEEDFEDEEYFLSDKEDANRNKLKKAPVAQKLQISRNSASDLDRKTSKLFLTRGLDVVTRLTGKNSDAEGGK